MTIEERLSRLEFDITGMDEVRRKEREEHRQLWRDTQLQIHELTLKIAANSDAIASLRDAIAGTNTAIAAETQRAKTAEDELRNRIAALTSGIGQLIAEMRARPPQ